MRAAAVPSRREGRGARVRARSVPALSADVASKAACGSAFVSELIPETDGASAKTVGCRGVGDAVCGARRGRSAGMASAVAGTPGFCPLLPSTLRLFCSPVGNLHSLTAEAMLGACPCTAFDGLDSVVLAKIQPPRPSLGICPWGFARYASDALRPPRPLSPAGPSPQRLTSLPSRPFPGGTVADYWLTSRPPPSFVLDCRKYYIVVLRTSARRRRRRSDKTRDAIIRGVGKIYFWPLMPETMSSTRRMSDAASIAVLTVCTLTA